MGKRSINAYRLVAEQKIPIDGHEQTPSFRIQHAVEDDYG